MKKILPWTIVFALLLGIHVCSNSEKPRDLAGEWQAVGYLFLGNYRPFSENKTMGKAFGDVSLSISKDGSFTYRKAFDFHGDLNYDGKTDNTYARFLMNVSTYDGTDFRGSAYEGLPFLLVKAMDGLVVVTEYNPETDKLGDLPLVLERIS